MKYFFNLLIFSIMFYSCSAYKAEGNQTFKYAENKVYFSDSLMNKVQATVNNIDVNLLFDTGSDITILYNNDKFSRLLNYLKETDSKDFNNNKIKIEKHTIDSLILGKSIFNNKIISTINKSISKNNCVNSSAIELDGILGNDILRYSKVLHLNYDKGYIEFLDSGDSIINEYIEIDSKFSLLQRIYIKLKINNVEDYFLFDTGNFSQILTNNDKIKDKSKLNSINTETILYGFSGNKNILNSIYLCNLNIDLSNNENINYSILYNEETKENNIGLSFIKNFNWIIDYANKKVYYKKIKYFELRKSNKKQFAFINDSVLIINIVFTDESKFKIGDQILSVNGEKVTSENICDMMQLLNNTENWEDLKIEIAK